MINLNKIYKNEADDSPFIPDELQEDEEWFVEKAKWIAKKMLLWWAIGWVVLVILIGSFYKPDKTWLEEKTIQLNSLNTLDAKDIESCIRINERAKQKTEILKEINEYKKTGKIPSVIKTK